MSLKEKIFGIVIFASFFGIWLIQGLSANGHQIPAILSIFVW